MMQLATMVLAAVVTVGLQMAASPASAGDRGRHQYNHRWDDWDNRRDARRAGIVAGTVAAGVVGSAGRANAREEYAECMREYASDMRYDRYCREEYHEDLRSGRRAARRTGVVVGLTTSEIVRH